MLQSYEGYLEKGQIYPLQPLLDLEGRRKVIITILDEPFNKKPDTWDELDKIISEMNELPRLEDFPRFESGHDLINFKEV